MTATRDIGGRDGRALASGPIDIGEDADTHDLAAIGRLLEVQPAIMNRARGLLTLLGDPGRRTVLERLSRRPENPGRSLPDLTGMNTPDVYHRLRSLRHRDVIVRNRHHVYSVDPAALSCASQYIDALMVAASLTQRRSL